MALPTNKDRAIPIPPKVVREPEDGDEESSVFEKMDTPLVYVGPPNVTDESVFTRMASAVPAANTSGRVTADPPLEVRIT